MLKLRFKNNKLSGVWLVEPKVTLGSASGNNLTISGDSSVVETHAEIVVEHESLTLVNLAEGHNLLLNGDTVNQPTPLKVGDELTVGNTVLEIIDPKTESRPAIPKKAPAAVAESASGWSMKGNTAALSNRVFPLRGEMVVGRSNDCDITLGAAHLSRRHAQLSIRDSILYVKDLGSSNGTYVNGKKIAETRVKHGDEVRFDTLSFTVMGPSEDLDKTTVRPMMAIDVEKASAAKAASSSAGAKPTPAATPKAGAAAPTAQPIYEPEPSSGMGIWVVMAVVVIGLVVAGLGWQQGWFGG